MIRKLKEWIWQRFLPVWAKETLLRDNQELRERNAKLKAELDLLKAYADGLEAGVRAQRRIIINNGGSKR